MTVAVIVLSLLCLGDLILTVGVVRRLREHSSALNHLAGDPPAVLRSPGEVVDDFTASTVNGEPVGRDRLDARTIVGFLSPTCGPCREQLPAFVARARQAPSGRTLAVVVGSGAAADDLATELADRLGDRFVVQEPPGGPVATAFGVDGYPAFALVGPGGRIEAGGFDLATIPVLVAA